MTYEYDNPFAQRVFWEVLDYPAFCTGFNEYNWNLSWNCEGTWEECVSYDWGRHYAADREFRGLPNEVLEYFRDIPEDIWKDINGVLIEHGFGPESPFARV